MNRNAFKHIHVTCAIIERDGLVLAVQRSSSMSMPLKWEFPGGKIDEGETPEACLKRELVEELGLGVTITRALPLSTHHYPAFTITLYPFVCTIEKVEMVLHEHNAAQWLPSEELPSLDWAEADYPVIDEYRKTENVKEAESFRMVEEFEVLAQGVFAEDDLLAEYKPVQGVNWEGDAGLYIENVWKDYVGECRAKGMSVYNGNIFRLDFHQVSERGLSLALSDTDFRSAVGTGNAAFSASFPQEPRANPLSVSVILVTTDSRIVLEERSRTNSWRRKYHVIAGFMEQGHDARDGKPHPFDTMRREVQEELALKLTGPLHATGLVRTTTGSELCFMSRLEISFEELLDIMDRGKTDAEIDTLITIDDSPAAVESFLALHPVDFVPSGRACLLLYGRVAYGEDWYERNLRHY